MIWSWLYDYIKKQSSFSLFTNSKCPKKGHHEWRSWPWGENWYTTRT